MDNSRYTCLEREILCVLILKINSESQNYQLQTWYETNWPRSLVCHRQVRCKVAQEQNWSLATDSGQYVTFCWLSQEINDQSNLLARWQNKLFSPGTLRV